MNAMDECCCFGVEPRADGSIVIASADGAGVTVERLAPAQADSSSVVKFVRDRSRTPRVCVASVGAGALALALAFGKLPEAEVFLLRPAALPQPSEPATARSVDDDGMAVALARYARRAA
jgi:hypothetical protein